MALAGIARQGTLGWKISNSNIGRLPSCSGRAGKTAHAQSQHLFGNDSVDLPLRRRTPMSVSLLWASWASPAFPGTSQTAGPLSHM